MDYPTTSIYWSAGKIPRKYFSVRRSQQKRAERNVEVVREASTWWLVAMWVMVMGTACMQHAQRKKSETWLLMIKSLNTARNTKAFFTDGERSVWPQTCTWPAHLTHFVWCGVGIRTKNLLAFAYLKPFSSLNPPRNCFHVSFFTFFLFSLRLRTKNNNNGPHEISHLFYQKIFFRPVFSLKKFQRQFTI